MEILVGAAALIVLAVILGIDVSLIYSAVMLVLFAAIILIVGFFAVCLWWLIRSRKAAGTLSKVDKNPRFKYDSAFYQIDGEEYPNIFPCEIVMKKYLYKQGRECKLYLNRKKGFVFDGNAFLCVIAGLVLGTGSAAVCAPVVIAALSLG